MKCVDILLILMASHQLIVAKLALDTNDTPWRIARIFYHFSHRRVLGNNLFARVQDDIQVSCFWR
jgi:predicted nuclease of restriction endonuclease-like (RecB) superfamily